MNKVVINKAMLGIFNMSACADKNATDEEILEVCNRENPSGTSNGWVTVVRKNHPEAPKESWPVICAADPNRLHFIIGC